MKKTIRKKFRRKKTIRKKNYKNYQKNKGGNNTIIIKDYDDLIVKKNQLVDSFDLLSYIYNNFYKKKKSVNFKLYIELIVMGIYLNPLSYNYFHNFFQLLVVNGIVKCEKCVDYSITIPGTGLALYKIYKIYFVIGFIIAYYYKNPTKFTSPEYLKKITGIPLIEFLIYLLKNPLSIIGCNNMWELSSYCYIIKSLDKFIETNQFDVSENEKITLIIFDFIHVIRYVYNLNFLFDIDLKPTST
jgi:hypothetical protein